MNFDGHGYKLGNSGKFDGKPRQQYHDRRSGVIGYDGLRYNATKSSRNRAFMNSFENEFNRGFRPKFGFNNTMSKF